MRIASIFIPVSLVAKADIRLQSTATVNASVTAGFTNSYVVDIPPASSGTVNGALAVSAYDATTAGDPVLATETANASIYLRARPALAFLNTVALLGVDMQIGPHLQLTAQVVANTPRIAWK